MKYRLTVLNAFAVFVLYGAITNASHEEHYQITIICFFIVAFFLIVDTVIQKLVARYIYANLIELGLLIFLYGFFFFVGAFK